MKKKRASTVEQKILFLQEISKSKAVSIGEILQILSGKGQSLIILFLSLPFCQPFQLPGLSIPFGLAIAVAGLKMAFGKYIWLPKRLLAKNVSEHSLQKITEKVLWLMTKMKRWVYPRLVGFCNLPCFQIFNGIVIAILGICLAMPLPIPFSNLLAAWSILFIGLGLIEDDGLFILLGYLLSLFTFVFFVATVLLIKHIF